MATDLTIAKDDMNTEQVVWLWIGFYNLAVDLNIDTCGRHGDNAFLTFTWLFLQDFCEQIEGNIKRTEESCQWLKPV